MKYFPLIWAALRRKPLRAVLTLLSVTTAFTLFGLMIGLNASFERIAGLARADRVFVRSRFGGGLPLALGSQFEHLNGVIRIGHENFVRGYYRDAKNFAQVIMMDPGEEAIVAVMPITAGQYDQLHRTRDGVFFSRAMADKLHIKAGDIFTAIASAPRADGGKAWPFHVLGIVNEVPMWYGGFILGNYDYYNKAAALADQNMVADFELQIRDPDRGDEISQAVDAMFANSSTPTRSISERAAYQSGLKNGIDIGAVTRDVAAAGLFMILFLTGIGIAQSVRERINEFAVMKTVGFSDYGVMALVFTEAAILCLGGAFAGIALAFGLSQFLPRFIPPGWNVPPPAMSSGVIFAAFGFAALVALVSAILPARRVKRLDVATALAGR